ncbi:unnamed protein product [Linum tenue]|uniref:Uncharacterized protein n=1 Tax=Linum tenue TaxID=586396 RepID=A0AAV0KWH7_9ROSI|nr:unnamed protein product [Linum tenue]
MAEPPIPAAVHGGAPAPLNAVFIDTNLDTHLAVMVASSDTVADLKRTITDEHPLCFPQVGEIKVDGLKVQRRGNFYYLSESMLVTNAFHGVQNGWFVSVEASIVPKDKEIEHEEVNLELMIMDNGSEEEGVNVVLDGRHDAMLERDLLGSQKESNDPVEVARGAQLVGGDDSGDKVVSMVPLVSDELVREDKFDEEGAREMDAERAETGKELSKIDAGSVLPEGASDVKEKRKKRKRSKKAADDLSGKEVDVSRHKLAVKGGEGEITLPETTASQERSEVDIDAMQVIVSESNAMTCEPPPLSQLPTIGEQQLATTTLEGPNADDVVAVDQLASQSFAKKKRKTKSLKNVDKQNVGVTPGEANAGEEVPLKEAGIISGNVAEEPPYSEAHMTKPSAVSLVEKDHDPLQEQQNNLPSQGINEFQEPTTNDMNRVETEQEVPKTGLTEVHIEVVDSISREVDPYVDDGKTSKKRKKSRKHKALMSGTVPVPSDADHVKDCYDVPEKEGKAEKSFLEAAGKEDVKEAAAADSLRSSLLVTDREIDEVIKNVVESAQRTTKTETVAENKEVRSRKKTKKHGSDGKSSVLLTQAEDKCTDESIPAPSTANIPGTDSSRIPYDANLRNPSFKDLLDRAEIGSPPKKVRGNADNASKVDGVDFSSYFTPKEQNKKTDNPIPSEVTGAWTKAKSEKKSEVHEGNLHDISPKLPGHPTLKEKLGASAKPQEKKPVPGTVDKRKALCEVAQDSISLTRPLGGKSKKRMEQHHSESSTNSTFYTKRGKTDPSQSQLTVVNGRRGNNAHPGEVVNGMAHPKKVVASRSLFKQDPFGDDSDDSLEPYHFPSPPNQSRASSPETYSNISVSAVDSDGETDTGFDSMNRNGISGRKGMKTPFSSGIPLDTILKSSKRYKKAKLDAESQPEDFVPFSPSPSI